MDVILRVVRVVVVDDKLDVVDIQATGGDVSGDEDRGAAFSKLSQDPVALLLLFVSVDAHGGVALPTHESGQVVGLTFCFNKDEDFVVRLTSDFFQEPGKFLLLLIFFADIDNLLKLKIVDFCISITFSKF